MEAAEAARRLGVKRATLYAYVSRGLLGSYPAADSRRSLFDADEVEALARRSRGGRKVETRLATVTTAVTQLRDDGPAYRGRPAVDLSRTATYEEVAELLWGADPPEAARAVPPTVGGGGHPSAAPDPALDSARPGGWTAVPLSVPAGLRPADRLRWAVVMVGAADPMRADLRPEAVRRVGRQLVATLASVAGPPPGPPPGSGTVPPPAPLATGDGPVAARLAAALRPTDAGTGPEATGPGHVAVEGAVEAAMVLLADHELATSTVAVRVAASTRADPYDAVLAGLAALAGPLHGGASELAYRLLVDAAVKGPEEAVADTLRWQQVLPGFGHSVFKDGDPRAPELLARFAEVARPEQRELVDTVVGLAAANGVPAPNVDLGLAAISWATGMPADAGRTLFSVARVAGWVAHYLEELDERPLRFRARAVYAS